MGDRNVLHGLHIISMVNISHQLPDPSARQPTGIHIPVCPADGRAIPPWIFIRIRLTYEPHDDDPTVSVLCNLADRPYGSSPRGLFGRESEYECG